MIDFGNFRRPDQKGRPTDPREIFKRRPSGEGQANDLWQGQAEALGAWFEQKKDETLILLNTGAGKTIIGLLIAQSYVNQGTRNVVYACSTIDLIHQTAKEAKKLGLLSTCRFSGKFDNDLFNQGRSFCITTYAALINPRTIFRGQLKPGAVILDDAHVANRTVRDSFTLRIPKGDMPALYSNVVELVRPLFNDLGMRIGFQAILRDDSAGSVLLVPPTGFFDLSDKLALLLDENISENDTSRYFPWLLIRDHLRFCACFIRNDVIEIAPPFLPTLTLQAFSRDVKRVYLSATLATRAEFGRVFGRRPLGTISPNVDAGDGERLFLFASKFETGRVSESVVQELASQTKVLVAVPSRPRAAPWSGFSVLPTRENFTAKLDEFRAGSHGSFLLVGRFDGIDLPGSQCRVMVIDGLPTGGNLIEQFLFEHLQMDRFLANTLSVRLTQLLGRIIRGRQDFGLFLVADRSAENWLKNERNRALLPELLRRQLFLSEGVESEIRKPIDANGAMEFARKVLGREQDWVDFYADNINELDVPEARMKESEEEDELLSEAGRSEVRFMTKLWDNDTSGAREELESLLRDVAVHDAMLAGWYAIWIGLTYYAEGKIDAAIDLFDEARRRVGRSLPLPRRQVPQAMDLEPPKTFIEDAIREIAKGTVMQINDRIAKLRISTENAFLGGVGHKKNEEAVREIGAALGFSSTRPCSDYGQGPDNLWIDMLKKNMIAFELKTEKQASSALKKEEVGQGLSHIEWLKKQFPEIKLIGLIYFGECHRITDQSSPADSMFFATPGRLRTIWDDFLSVIERVRPRTEIERFIEAKKIGELPEWSCEGIFSRIAEKKLS